ncbi:twin-arginine translocase TatA/TatE family subunit [Brevibacterium sp.]|uniref:twin-arginine translocase TatA/TatE family subunit n=1 Tax=Brevibacterium sp. TaxID=1701 RepID=UPI002810D98B|nr:twin-arginine translocase TatA/TatE family subunit [Brevibacterium sp.]
MFGINGTEMLILVVVALVVIGPKRLPEYAEKLRDLVRQARRMAEGAKESVQRDFGDEFKDVDWQKLDPRQYDPRRIVREALVEEDTSIRESKRTPKQVSTPGAGTGTDDDSSERHPAGRDAAESDTDGIEADAEAESQPAPMRSPIERFQAQAARRVRAEAAPFDPDAT